MKVHYMSKSNEWSTPQIFYDRLDKDFSFTLDPQQMGLMPSVGSFSRSKKMV